MHLFRSIYGELDPFGRFWLYVGLAALAAAAAMSFATINMARYCSTAEKATSDGKRFESEVAVNHKTS